MEQLEQANKVVRRATAYFVRHAFEVMYPLLRDLAADLNPRRRVPSR